MAGGNILKYNGETSTEIASIKTAKLFIDNILSTTNEKFIDMDILNFYIQTDLNEY